MAESKLTLEEVNEYTGMTATTIEELKGVQGRWLTMRKPMRSGARR